MEYDHSDKLLFSHREMMADLFQGFVAAEWLQAIDLATLERLHSSHGSDDLRGPLSLRESSALTRLVTRASGSRRDGAGRARKQWTLPGQLWHARTHRRGRR